MKLIATIAAALVAATLAPTGAHAAPADTVTACSTTKKPSGVRVTRLDWASGRTTTRRNLTVRTKLIPGDRVLVSKRAGKRSPVVVGCKAKPGRVVVRTSSRRYAFVAETPVVQPAPQPQPEPTTEPTPEPVPTLAALVDQAIADFARLDDGTLGAHPYAWVAEAIAVRRGWDDPQVAAYLAKVYAQQNPDGGYGINAAWDAFGDGTVNAADTTYAITLTDHVGPVFLAGYKAGVVPRERVEQVVEQVERFPLAEGEGTCVSYSTTPSDARWCTGNINASAAHFLWRADQAGFDVDMSRVPGIVAMNRATLVDGEWWTYSSGETARQDWYHNVTMVEASMDLDPPVGRVAFDAMRRATVADPWERAAMLRLARYDCGLADAGVLKEALDSKRGDAYYTGLLAYIGATAIGACGVR